LKGKIKLCKGLLKIINKEFELEELKNHIINCEECQKTLKFVYLTMIENINPMFKTILKNTMEK
jgi:hypothetical protein